MTAVKAVKALSKSSQQREYIKVISLSLACSSMYSLCWFELDKAFTLLPGNLKDK